MKLKLLGYTMALASLLPGLTQANVTEADFIAKRTQNLLNLCTASPQDPQYREAIHFCHGYLVGAYHFYSAEAADKPDMQFVCFPEPKPSRNEAIDLFISWAQKHPEYMNEMPVETEFRFLAETWPCRKQ